MSGTTKTVAEKLREVAEDRCKYSACTMLCLVVTGSDDCADEACSKCRKNVFIALADMIEVEQAKPQLPEGIEWPRFEDGELVKFGDEYCDKWGNTGTVGGFVFDRKGFSIYVTSSGTGEHAYGTPVKRPELDVLDADGVPIKVGDTVWYEDKPYAVLMVNEKYALLDTDEGFGVSRKNKYLTHRKPDTFKSVVTEMLADFDGSDSIELDGYFDRLRKLTGGE